jgi:hypothetical protein
MPRSSKRRGDRAGGGLDVVRELLHAGLHAVGGAADGARADDVAVAVVHGHGDTGGALDDLVDADADAGGADLVERILQGRHGGDRAVGVSLQRQRLDDLFALVARHEREDGFTVGGGVNRAALPDVDGVADQLFALDDVDEDDGAGVTGDGGEERGVPGAAHERFQRGPCGFDELAPSVGSGGQLDGAGAEAVLAGPALLQIPAGAERPY